MSSEQFRDRIVVGASGAPEADVAVDWAARRAHSRGTGLTLLRVESPFALHHLEPRRGHDGADSLLAQAEALVGRYPGLDVDTCVMRGHPAQTMIRASKDALLTVLGTRGAQGMKGRLYGGNAPEVITFARGPIVVVPQWVTEQPTGPVIVGLDDSPEVALASLEEALMEASATDSSVVAVHVLRAPTAASTSEAQRLAAADLERVRAAELETMMAPARERHPDIPLEVKVVHSMPVRALTEASASASMVLLAHRAGPGLSGWMRTSTSRRVAVAAACPVMVTRAALPPGVTHH